MYSVLVIVDTSVWVEFLRGTTQAAFERALQDGRVLVTPIVAAELLSGTKNKREVSKLEALFDDLGLLTCLAAHWFKVGALRRELDRKGLHTSIPDAHIAVCASERSAVLMSHDQVFEKIAKLAPLNLVAAR
jgi:tRNA(fMet)-specific endonuclease VapC